MKILSLAMLVTVAVPISSDAQPSCPIERAHYALRNAPEVTAGFRNLPQLRGWLTTIVLHVDFSKQPDHVWWLFDQGSARYLNMISTPDVDAPGWKPPDEASGGKLPFGEMHVWFASRTYNLSYNLPKPGQAAPEHLFIPDLEEAIWYQAEPRRAVPTQFFDLKSCG